MTSRRRVSGKGVTTFGGGDGRIENVGGMAAEIGGGVDEVECAEVDCGE